MKDFKVYFWKVKHFKKKFLSGGYVFLLFFFNVAILSSCNLIIDCHGPHLCSFHKEGMLKSAAAPISVADVQYHYWHCCTLVSFG